MANTITNAVLFAFHIVTASLSSYPFSVQLLKATGAGLALKRISEFKSDTYIITKAKELCASWKALYLAHKADISPFPASSSDSTHSINTKSTVQPKLSASQSQLDAIAIGRLFERAETWRAVYETCESIQSTRNAELGAKLKERDRKDVADRHTAAMLEKAPGPQISSKATKNLQRSATTPAGYQQGRSIRQTLTGSGRSTSQTTALKRPAHTVLLGKSTKRVKTIVTPSGSVMRLPRK